MCRVCKCLAVFLLLAAAVAAGNRPAVAAGLAGNALKFDGVNDFVNIPDDASLSLLDYTIEVWFKLETSPSTFTLDALISKGAAINTCLALTNYSLFVNSSNKVFFSYEPLDGCVDFEDVTPSVLNLFGGEILIGEWAHVAAVFENGGGLGPDFFNAVRIYVNGVFKLQNTNAPLPQQNTADVVLGNFFSNLRPMQGELDEVRIWNVARTDAEIADNFDKFIDPSTPGLVGYWNFDEAVSDQNVLDLAALGGNSDGTLGANLSVDTDDPLRVASTAPVTPTELAQCSLTLTTLEAHCAESGPVFSIFHDLAEPFSLPEDCACPAVGVQPAVESEPCVDVPRAEGACFDPTQDVVLTTPSGITIVDVVDPMGGTHISTVYCYAIDGIRICQSFTLPD